MCLRLFFFELFRYGNKFPRGTNNVPLTLDDFLFLNLLREDCRFVEEMYLFSMKTYQLILNSHGTCIFEEQSVSLRDFLTSHQNSSTFGLIVISTVLYYFLTLFPPRESLIALGNLAPCFLSYREPVLALYPKFYSFERLLCEIRDWESLCYSSKFKNITRHVLNQYVPILRYQPEKYLRLLNRIQHKEDILTALRKQLEVCRRYVQVMSELKVLPSSGFFKGGEEYRKARKRWKVFSSLV